VFDDLRAVRPLHLAEADPLAHVGGCSALRASRRHVNLPPLDNRRCRDVVESEMGYHDVAHVVTPKAKLLNLIDGGLGLVEDGAV